MKIALKAVKSLAILFTCLSFANIAQSQTAKSNTAWPKQAIRIVVTFTPGGAPDILARVLAESWQQSLGVPVLVENRPGYGGNIGADLVAKSEPDGYTLLIGTVGIHSINGALYDKMSFHPINDFTPISFLASTPNVLVVNKKLGVTNLHELIELAKAKPNELTFGSSGVGTSLHMSGELFKEMTGVQIRHIPYKGRAQSLPDLISGRITMLFDNLSSSLSLIKAGEVQALGVTTLKRSPAAPEIPTMAEQGLPGFEAISWFSLMAPANLPPAVQKQLNALTRQTLNQAEVKKKLLASGLDPAPGSPQELSKLIQSEANKWGRVIYKSGAKLD
ncbi:MAG: ABC transporter substrate-binding protein [Polynucleobacter sp. 24-46-87]|jgi:tripartite-type tricarboxylate transporter receptor subunit TctC|uniref:Bug family tripartite tricarboxylate transporter substrate binding protein n=1 Tax=unclassified Polynucleobacter TaxID=2640945 RepID=UPI000BC63B4D|nr:MULTISPECIES: tripartite tricarboxylate transporter substrate binding protein [unclassified Polynucleobacter]OYY19345.1 MAG: ABC transporter substrate-binding protein [Polynucleobacter sp. 35-46-11]OZA14807.1 MAG: ABC transporter substrate-binding protein [Polynucleobacter sp. 24-46-87]OZA75672.1 MAG: ABC transporter substrate-binding protein [Polynucleobacter sp. 39-46-10]